MRRGLLKDLANTPTQIACGWRLYGDLPPLTALSGSEVVGTSTESIDDAIRGAVDRANMTVRHLDWFEVVNVRGHVKDGQVAHFQVTIKLGFRLDPAGSDQDPTGSSAPPHS